MEGAVLGSRIKRYRNDIKRDEMSLILKIVEKSCIKKK